MANYLRLTPSRDAKGNLYLENGLIAFRLGLWVNGKEIDSVQVNSGGLGRQDEINLKTYLSTNSLAGSMEPIPEYRYKLGGPEFAVPNSYTGSWGAGLGPVWFSIIPSPGGGNRSEFGIHLDENRSYAPGSAGCVVAPTVSALKKIVDWHSKYSFKELVVDHGLGTVSKPEVADKPAKAKENKFKYFSNQSGTTLVVYETLEPGEYTLYSEGDGWSGKLVKKTK